MITSKNGRRADTDNYVHGCFMVRVGSPFKTYIDILKNSQTNVDISDADYNTNVAKILNGVSDATGSSGYIPLYASKRKCRDTTLGGNDAINPLPQFSVDDDVVHPHHLTNYGNSVGMGRVYSENYDDTQQILYLGFGIPVFSNMGSFWKNAIDKDVADFVNKGSAISAEKIGYLIGSAPIRLFKLATIPYKFIAAMVDGLQYVPITKYYAFSSQMPMYFRFVNTMLVMLATNMNIMGSSESNISTTGSDSSSATPVDLINQGTQGTQDVTSMPSIFSGGGLDMAQIMLRRYFYEFGSGTDITKRSTDEAMFKASQETNKGYGVVDYAATEETTQSTNPDPNATNTATGSTDQGVADFSDKTWQMGWFDAFAAAYKNAIYDGHLFIGFRVDKGMGTSESFSNNTGESNVAQLANSKFQEARGIAYDTMGGKFGNGPITGVMTAAFDSIKGFLQGAANTFKLDPLAAAITGAAKVDIPEVWMGSGYSRSASFSITCLSPYGDIESIFMSEYVPLACILAGTLPRGTGLSSHSSPFICQAYCRGVFSSPLCMIESLEVTRGADQFGFNADRLPLKLSMHVTLKDLTPTMYMSMGGDKGITQAIFGTDDNFGEYMLTLSGMGLRDRLAPFRSIRRKAQILLSTIYKNKLSPFMLGMEGGSRFMISRVISTMTSGGRGLPGN